MSLPYAILDSILINAEEKLKLEINRLPDCLKYNTDCGIITNTGIEGDVVYRASMDKHLYEVRGTITPKGDMLLMFPCGKHYGGGFQTKVNDMISVRSKDKGVNWEKPTIGLAIDYSQHGFVPLIQKNSSTIYCFGTQPVWSHYDPKNGNRENAPIGYFTSDDFYAFGQ